MKYLFALLSWTWRKTLENFNKLVVNKKNKVWDLFLCCSYNFFETYIPKNSYIYDYFLRNPLIETPHDWETFFVFNKFYLRFFVIRSFSLDVSPFLHRLLARNSLWKLLILLKIKTLNNFLSLLTETRPMKMHAY